MDTRRDLIVIGASLGGIKPLTQIVETFPVGLPAVVCVVLHIPAWRRSDLPEILSAAGRLRALHPTNFAPLERGHIYVAPPDQHLMIDGDRAFLWHGPRESQHRPSINVLFRSAAVMAGARVVGVVLSGALDDGAAGLWWIKRHGGVAIVQDPFDAVCAEMPNAALSTAAIDYVLPASSIGHRLLALVRGEESDAQQGFRGEASRGARDAS